MNAGAAVSLIAFGATFIGIALLLLLNPNSSAVRWYAAFNITILLWLGTQGAALLTRRDPSSLLLFQIAVHMLPAMFLASALARGEDRSRFLLCLGIVVAAAALFPALYAADWRIARFWHVLLWCGGAAVYVVRAVRGRGRRARGTRRTTRGERTLEIVLSAFVPLGVTAAVLAQGTFVLVMLPVLTVLVLLLVFSGIVFHRYYDIEVRAARTGELATAVAEHDRLALLGELSATIAHEVRNPLTGIRSLTQLMAEPNVADDRRIRYAGVVLDEVTRLDRIVGNLTDLARRSTREASAVSDTELDALLDDLRLLTDARAKRATVTVDMSGGGVVLRAAREALAQALLNLLLNAIAQSPERGVVRVRAHRSDAHIDIVVTDEGPGVAPEQRAKIFEPFHTRGGTGLGLTVVRRLADEHGWTVTVGDAPGGGAAFAVRVPQ